MYILYIYSRAYIISARMLCKNSLHSCIVGWSDFFFFKFFWGLALYWENYFNYFTMYCIWPFYPLLLLLLLLLLLCCCC